MLLKCCTQYASKFGKLSSGHKTGKGQFSFQSQKKGNAKECSNYHTIVLISYASKVMLKILQARLQQYMKWELQMYKLGLEEAEELEVKLPTFTRSQRKQGNSRKISTSASLTTLKPLTGWITRNWKILQDHLTCLLRNLYAGQAATVRTGHGTTDWFQIGKGVCQGCILSSCLFNLEYIRWNASLDEAQAGIKIARRNINNLRYADDTTLMAESEEELESSWWKWKRRVKKFA